MTRGLFLFISFDIQLEPKREPAIMTIGHLQPRGPCGSEKLGDLSGWVLPTKPTNPNSPTEESRETKTSQLKATTESNGNGTTNKGTSFYGCNLLAGDRCQEREIKPPSTLFI